MPLALPLVIAHRGASGYRPEHTIAAYELAVAMGADYIEPDLVMTKDGVLVDRHEPEISTTTDVAEHPEFASRQARKVIDGVARTGWFTEDLTLAELKTLRAKERLPQERQANAAFDGQYQVLTYAEGLELREALSRASGRTIGIIPEIKHSTYLHSLGFNPEQALVTLTREYGLDTPDAPIWVQSFEYQNLLDLRACYGFRGKLTFLIDTTGGPYDFVARGEPRNYADLLEPESLRGLSAVVDGISPDQRLILPVGLDGAVGSATGLVADAHAAGLQVIPWTVRAENAFLPREYQIGTDPAGFGRVSDYLVRLLQTGIDGVFTDQPDLAYTARQQFLAESHS